MTNARLNLSLEKVQKERNPLAFSALMITGYWVSSVLSLLSLSPGLSISPGNLPLRSLSPTPKHFSPFLFSLCLIPSQIFFLSLFDPISLPCPLCHLPLASSSSVLPFLCVCRSLSSSLPHFSSHLVHLIQSMPPCKIPSP